MSCCAAIGTPGAPAQNADFGTRLPGTAWVLDHGIRLADVVPAGCGCSITVSHGLLAPSGNSSGIRLTRFDGGVRQQGAGQSVTMQFVYEPTAVGAASYALTIRGTCNCNQHGYRDHTIRVSGRSAALDWESREGGFTATDDGKLLLGVGCVVPAGVRHDFSPQTVDCTLRWATAAGVTTDLPFIHSFRASVTRQQGALRFWSDTRGVQVTGSSFRAEVPQQPPTSVSRSATRLTLTIDEGDRVREGSENNNVVSMMAAFRAVEDVEGWLQDHGFPLAAQLQHEWKAGPATYASSVTPDLGLRPFFVPWHWVESQPGVRRAVRDRFQRVIGGLETTAGRAALLDALRAVVAVAPNRTTLNFGTTSRWDRIYTRQTQLRRFGGPSLVGYVANGGFTERDYLLGSFAIYGMPTGQIEHLDSNCWAFAYQESSVVLLDNFTFADAVNDPSRDNQPLGIWPSQRFGPVPLTNRTYLLWQRLLGRGEDRLVVSGPQRLPLLKPDNTPRVAPRQFEFRR
ncbi:MAG: hypothetical protein KDC98_15145 [Planctomycetes bacterium]|nr:hypothetical protein [Planctomycetota bacterium]